MEATIRAKFQELRSNLKGYGVRANVRHQLNDLEEFVLGLIPRPTVLPTGSPLVRPIPLDEDEDEDDVR